MGFDQYHEPPEELPAETRTFARLCASLTEEAEAIGWYEQRLAVETDAEAAAIMRDAQGEEFKHFSMDLEFLLRRTPGLARDRQGRPVPGRRHRRARRGGRGGGARGRRRRGRRRRARGRLAWDRQPEGGSAMNHLLRSHAPISDAGWELLDDEARERLVAGARGPQAGRLLRAARLAAFGDQPGPHERRWRSPRATGVTARAAAGPAAGRAACRFELSREELRDADRGAVDADLEPLDTAAHQIAVAENIAVFHGWPEASIAGIAEASPHEPIQLGDRRRRLPAPGRRRRRAAAAQRHRRSLRARARRRAVPARRRDGRARRLPAARPPAQDPRGPDRVGAGGARRGRAEPARRRLPVRIRAGPVDRLRRPRRARSCASISRRASASTSRRPRLRSPSWPSRHDRSFGHRWPRRQPGADARGGAARGGTASVRGLLRAASQRGHGGAPGGGDRAGLRASRLPRAPRERCAGRRSSRAHDRPQAERRPRDQHGAGAREVASARQGRADVPGHHRPPGAQHPRPLGGPASTRADEQLRHPRGHAGGTRALPGARGRRAAHVPAEPVPEAEPG